MEIKFAFSGKWHLHQCIYKISREVLKASIPNLIRIHIRVFHNNFENKNLWKLFKKKYPRILR